MALSKKNIAVGNHLSLSDIETFLHNPTSVSLSASVLAKVIRSKKFLTEVASREIIYGVNTGFGPLARTYVQPSKQRELQYNLVRSHAVGQGEALPEHFVRVMMLLRLHTLAQGFSGVLPEILYGLKHFLEKGITPVVFEHGSVGASGDLVQLAHIALALIGEGEVFFKGKRTPTMEALAKCKLKPVELHYRDGLALINGTSAMTAIAAVNLIEGEQLAALAVTSSALLLELVGAHEESLHPLISRARPHLGQAQAARMMRNLLKGSRLIHHRRNKRIPTTAGAGTVSLNTIVQEIYSLRCSPQILGPVIDTLSHAKKVVETEINSVTDNPIVSPGEGIFHAGNFHGDYVALEMDKVKIAITKLSMLLERQLNFLCNPRLNGILPPFITLGTSGLDLGFQGLQFVATSTAAENQMLATPMSTHSIPTNNDNQDIVSMGTNAALLTTKVIENTYQIQAILSAAIVQSVVFLSIINKLGRGTKQAYEALRRLFTPFTKDHQFLREDLSRLSRELRNFSKKGYQQ